MKTALALTRKGETATRKPRRRLGRRSLYTPALQRRICQLLEKGNTIATTCDHVGISDETYRTWCDRHPGFLGATSRARGKARVKLVKVLTDASKLDWRAAGWLLSRCWPNEFSEIVRGEVAMAGGIILLPAKEQGAE